MKYQISIMKYLKCIIPLICILLALNAVGQNAKEKEMVEAAVILFKDGKYEETKKLCNSIIKINPLIPRVFNIRGLANKNEKNFDLAILDFNKALDVDPKYKKAYYNRANVYLEVKNYHLAILDYNNTLKIDPSDTSAYYMRGMAHYSGGNYISAIEDFKTTLLLNPDDGMSALYLISLFIRTGQYSEANLYYARFSQKKGFSFIENNLYWNFYKPYVSAANSTFKDDYEGALEYLNFSIKKFENSWQNMVYNDVLAFKGNLLEKMNRNAEAMHIYEQVLSMSSDQPDIIKAIANLAKKQEAIAKTDKIPPSIELISPQTTRGLILTSANDLTQIIGRAKDASGIAQITINGKGIKAEEDGLFVSNMALKAGINEIVVSATDKQGNKAAKTFSINSNIVAKQDNIPVEIVMPSAAATPQYHALLIASQDYTDASIPDLENPIKDAKELSIILQDNYTFPSKNIETVYNRSREEIMQAIVQKCNSLSENDNLLIFYAGHGIGEKDKFGDVDGYWIPSSAKKGLNPTYISSDDINKALKRSNAKHILVIADACFSGAFTRELPGDASVGVQKQYSVPSRKIMASGNMEPVPDNSRFVFYLKKNLTENKEKYLTSKKLFDSFYEAILNNSDTSPQYAAIKNVGDEGGEFVFIKK